MRFDARTFTLCRSLGVAFHDLQALMTMAADMVKLAERFRGVMAQVRSTFRVSFLKCHES